MQVEGSNRSSSWGGAIAGGWNRRWRGAIVGGGERSQVQGSDQRWRGAIKDGGGRSQVEGSRQWPEVYDLCHTFMHVARVKNTRTCVFFLTFKFSVSLSAGGLASVSGGPSRRVRVTVSRPNQPGRPCLASCSQPPTRRHPSHPRWPFLGSPESVRALFNP